MAQPENSERTARKYSYPLQQALLRCHAYSWYLLGLLAMCQPASAAYLIELENGHQFLTPHYWREGNEIRFYLERGVVGFDRDLVRALKEIDLPYRSRDAVAEVPSNSVDATNKAEVSATIQGVARPDDRVRNLFLTLSEKSAEMAQMSGEELLQYARELESFREALLDDHLLRGHLEEFRQATAVLDKVEELVKERGH